MGFFVRMGFFVFAMGGGRVPPPPGCALSHHPAPRSFLRAPLELSPPSPHSSGFIARIVPCICAGLRIPDRFPRLWPFHDPLRGYYSPSPLREPTPIEWENKGAAQAVNAVAAALNLTTCVAGGGLLSSWGGAAGGGTVDEWWSQRIGRSVCVGGCILAPET